MADLPPISIVLNQKGIPHKVFSHLEPPKTLEQAAAERGQNPEQIIRSILFRVSEGEYCMVLIAGPGQINWKTLRKHLRTSRLRMASKDEVLSITGYQLGAVAPFGIKTTIRILVDHSVQQQQTVSMGSGTPRKAIIIRTSDLIHALENYEFGDFGSFSAE